MREKLRLLKHKILGIIGLCKKAGKLVFGFDAVLRAVLKKKSGTILISCDFSVKSLNNIKEKLNNFNAQIIILKDITMQDIYCVLKNKTGVILIQDEGFACAVRKLLS